MKVLSQCVNLMMVQYLQKNRLQLYKVKVGGGGRVQLEPDEVYPGGGSCLEDLPRHLLAAQVPTLHF